MLNATMFLKNMLYNKSAWKNIIFLRRNKYKSKAKFTKQD